MKDGIYLELFRSEDEISEMMASWRRTHMRSDVKTACLEDVIRNSTSFQNFWSDALSFWGFSVPKAARTAITEALAKSDMHSGQCESCTQHSANKQNTYADLIVELAAADSEHNRGMLQAMSTEVGCHK